MIDKSNYELLFVLQRADYSKSWDDKIIIESLLNYLIKGLEVNLKVVPESDLNDHYFEVSRDEYNVNRVYLYRKNET